MFSNGSPRRIRWSGRGCRAIERAVLREDGSIVLVFVAGDPTPVAAASIALDELHKLASRPLGQAIFQGRVNSFSFRSDALPTILTSSAPPESAPRIDAVPAVLH